MRATWNLLSLLHGMLLPVTKDTVTTLLEWRHPKQKHCTNTSAQMVRWLSWSGHLIGFIRVGEGNVFCILRLDTFGAVTGGCMWLSTFYAEETRCRLYSDVKLKSLGNRTYQDWTWWPHTMQNVSCDVDVWTLFLFLCLERQALARTVPGSNTALGRGLNLSIAVFFKAEELLESLTTVPECQRENPIHLVIADSCCPSTDFATGLQGSFNLQYLYI